MEKAHVLHMEGHTVTYRGDKACRGKPPPAAASMLRLVSAKLLCMIRKISKVR